MVEVVVEVEGKGGGRCSRVGGREKDRERSTGCVERRVSEEDSAIFDEERKRIPAWGGG